MTERIIPDIGRMERDGQLILPTGWAASFELRVAAFAAYLLGLSIRYESGRTVPLNKLARGLLGR